MENLSTWKKRGFNPKNIFDIGAHRGEWTGQMRKIFTESDYYLFEAYADNNVYNREKNYYNVFLDKTDKQNIDFFYSQGQHTTGSSKYLELSNYFIDKGYNKTTLVTRKLDNFIKENNIPYPDFIKLDVQGSELDVLEGSRECLEKTTMVLMEVSLHRYNKNAPLFADVIKYMDSINFEAIDIIDRQHCHEYLLQVDILFARKGSGFRLDTMVL